MVETEFLTHTLQNGIRLIHKPTDSPVGHLGILINTGSRDEEPEEHGLAHFIEHSVFKGTQKRRAFHILSRIEDVGGELNAYTTKEETTLFSTFLAEFYDRTAELLSDILFNSTYPEKELNREKEVIFEEINSYKDSPSELIFDEFEELVYNGHPIARNILGTPENLNRLNRRSILRFIQNNYHTDQMVISSVGKIDFGKLVKLIEKYFGVAPANTRQNGRERFQNYIPGIRIMEKDTFQSHCVIGNVAYDILHPKRITMVLLNNIIGGQAMNSRLNMALRERKGMAYNIESGYTAYSDTGLFNVYFGTDRENLGKATDLVLKEFKLLREKKLGTVQLRKAQKQIIGQIAISTENREDLMLTIGKSYLLFNKVEPMRTIFKKIEAITPADLMEAANEVLQPDQMSRLVYR
ncbi:Predicted Zn-dependent peptidase [Tangfeifania diversioriginum]|uniref:Predicted Zn-dependent peptidase n=1 Tax=Tangfeifania diversioriginum TaxID=1168035 RepID=A0A1M6DU29_9BACT|nr:pitrilysin family protein [Tangfeifania diversioriginum]SHI76673.1 Predicted Zn-dependent peptidase [Tangfeifania diversioriginum]